MPYRVVPFIFIVVTVACSHTCIADAPATNPALMKQMSDIDARASRITTMVADFEQRKFTALMRRPVISSGTVRVKGAMLRWDTVKPDANVVLVNENSVSLYYPAQHTEEIYTIDQRLAQLAASPLPRLAVLREHFTFEQVKPTEVDPTADPAKTFAVKMTPTQKELAEHVQQVRVVLDVAGAYILMAEITDADGDRTEVRFSHQQLNASVGDLELKLPAGTKVVRPMDSAPAPAGKSKS